VRLIDADALMQNIPNEEMIAKMAVANAPSIELEPKRGEWIKVDDVSISCRCSVCGWEAHLYEDDVYGMPYCPNCGADMREREGE